MRRRLVGSLLLAITSLSCAQGGETPTAPQSGEAFCSAAGFYFCGSTQGNLQTPGLPSGVFGYCQVGVAGMGLVGYSATTVNGGADLVRPFSDAQQTCNALNIGVRQCLSITTCTRR